jgi:hypothetical protein
MRATVLETRAQVPPERKIHPSGNDNASVGPDGAQRRQCNGVRRVRMDDVCAGAANHSSQRKCADEIELSVRREPNDFDTPLGRTSRQLIITPGHDHRAMAAVAHPCRQPQDLALASAPAALRVDVQDRQQTGVPLGVIF